MLTRGGRSYCQECGELRDPNLKYCGNCGARQISLFSALNLYWIVWFMVLALVYLGESALILPDSGAGSLPLANYVLIAGVTTIVVVPIFLYGGKIAGAIEEAIHS